MKPIDPTVDAIVSRLDDNLREMFEERAAARTFLAGRPRELAEALALLDVIRMNPLAVSGVVAMKVQLDGEVLIVLTTDAALAGRHLLDIGAKPVGPADLAEAVRQFGIAAVLAHLG